MYLAEKANMEITGGYYYNRGGAPPGHLLYRLSAPHPFRQGLFELSGFNNGSFIVSTSRDGQTFDPVLSNPAPPGSPFNVRLPLRATIWGAPTSGCG